MNKILTSIITVYGLLFFACSMGPIAGGGSDLPDTKVVGGFIYNENNIPAAGAQVTIIPSTHNPVKDQPLPNSFTDTTDASGTYSIHIPDTGTYTIQAVHLLKRTRLSVPGVYVQDDTTVVPPGTLRDPGILKVFLPDSVDPVNGYIYLTGTTTAKSLGGNTVSVIIDSVPAGIIPSIYYATVTDTLPVLVRYNVTVTANEVATITMPTWRYSMRLFLNTSSTGAQISGDVVNFPVLVRLSSANFNFSQAMPGGEDIRFTRKDNSLLPYEIEYWNAADQKAVIWVKVDTVYGNTNTRHIIMAWGASTSSSSNSAAVFDTAAGFQGVWHLSNEGNSPVYDATCNRFNGTPQNMTASSSVGGMIGKALDFDGISSYISIPGTASGKLNFPVKGTYSLAAWVYTDSLRGPPYSVLRNSQEIISKGDLQYNLDVDANDRWHMSEVEDVVGYHRVEAAAQARLWTFVVGVRNGDVMDLYINGQLQNDSLFTSGAGSMRDTTWDVVIGKMSDQNNRYFDGKIDEVRIANVALTPDWIRLCYMNQKPDDALIEFKQ